LRHLDRDGSIDEAFRTLLEKGIKTVNLGTFPRDKPIGAELRKAERKGIAVFTVEGLSYKFLTGLVASRNRLYTLLKVKDDIEAYNILWSLSAAKPLNRRIFSKEFEHTFKYMGSSLELLPAIKFYRLDGGYYTTSSIIVACYRKICNASVHRVMVSYDYSYATVRVVPRHLHALWEKADKRLPVAIIYGVDPVVLLIAATSPPFGVFELELASQLFGGLDFCTTPKYKLPIPCSSSIVVEGVLGPELEYEGPFVDLLDVYDKRRKQPVLHVDGIYVNRDKEPYVHAIVPGGLEHRILMGLPREAAIFQAVSRVVPFVRKVRLTPSSGMWLHAVISIKKQHDGDGKNAAFAALAAHPSLKHVIVVDEDIDPDDISQVEWAIATRLQAGEGIVIIPHARGSTLDPSAEEGLTYKLIIDATVPVKDRDKYVRVAE
jgi:UbiD family decarboxylase